MFKENINSPYEIKRGIPIPPRGKRTAGKQNTKRRFPFPLMKKGDYIDIPVEGSNGDTDVALRSICNAARVWAMKAGLPRKFVTRKYDGLIRLWRQK